MKRLALVFTVLICRYTTTTTTKKQFALCWYKNEHEPKCVSHANADAVRRRQQQRTAASAQCIFGIVSWWYSDQNKRLSMELSGEWAHFFALYRHVLTIHTQHDSHDRPILIEILRINVMHIHTLCVITFRFSKVKFTLGWLRAQQTKNSIKINALTLLRCNAIGTSERSD